MTHILKAVSVAVLFFSVTGALATQYVPPAPETALFTVSPIMNLPNDQIIPEVPAIEMRDGEVLGEIDLVAEAGLIIPKPWRTSERN